MSGRAQLVQRVLQMLATGNPVPEHDALQLRNWAVNPEERSRTKDPIALKPSDREAGDCNWFEK
jgi:hypothetical protein